MIAIFSMVLFVAMNLLEGIATEPEYSEQKSETEIISPQKTIKLEREEVIEISLPRK